MKPREIVIVDDCSTDGTGQIDMLNTQDIIYIRHEHNKGAAAARNTGIKNASGVWIAFLDSDDIWLTEKLEHQIAFMQDEGLSLSCTNYLLKNPAGNDRGHNLIQDKILEKDEVFWGCYLCPGSTLVAKKALFHEIGFFDEKLKRLEDWDWFIRIGRKHRIGNMRELLSVIQVLDYPDPELVTNATELIKAKYIQNGDMLTDKQKRMVLAALYVEQAKMAWVRRDYLLMTVRLLRSLSIAPIGNKALKYVLARKLRYGI